MAGRPEEFRQQMNEVWQQAAEQLELVKKALQRSADRFEADLQRLRAERNKVLKQLRQQTQRLVTQGKVPMPAWVKKTADRLNSAIDSVVKKTGSESRSRRSAKKPRTRTARKTTKRAAH